MELEVPFYYVVRRTSRARYHGYVNIILNVLSRAAAGSQHDNSLESTRPSLSSWLDATIRTRSLEYRSALYCAKPRYCRYCTTYIASSNIYRVWTKLFFVLCPSRTQILKNPTNLRLHVRIISIITRTTYSVFSTDPLKLDQQQVQYQSQPAPPEPPYSPRGPTTASHSAASAVPCRDLLQPAAACQPCVGGSLYVSIYVTLRVYYKIEGDKAHDVLPSRHTPSHIRINKERRYAEMGWRSSSCLQDKIFLPLVPDGRWRWALLIRYESAFLCFVSWRPPVRQVTQPHRAPGS
jgi:hypothetical protein